MITCDEGTLAYCAARIACEITRDPAWKSPRLDVPTINLWDEVAEVAHSARLIGEDRETCERLEQGRLHNDPDVLVSFLIQSPLQCTIQQPYPYLPTSICVGYGIACPRSACNAAPGTPGEWDVNGRYTPKQG